MEKELDDTQPVYPIAQSGLPVETKTEVPKDDITIGPIPQEYVQHVQQQQCYPTETDLEQQQQQQQHDSLDEQQRQALAGHYQHVAGTHPHLLGQQMGDISQQQQQQQPGQPALMTPFMNPAQYYEAHAAQAQHWSQQMQHYNQWQYQQQWQYHNWQYQQYHLQQQWQRHYLNRGRRDSSRRRKDRTVCQELHPKFEPNYKIPRKAAKKRSSPLLSEERIPEEDGPTIGIKQKCMEHAIQSTTTVDDTSLSSSQNLAILAAVAVADLEKGSELDVNVNEHEKAMKKVAEEHGLPRVGTIKTETE